ncbi:MAG TPA: hypothetical protein VMF30_05380 [Pirellulales bacterium]|nr:hypothetical protein [Pirellulales bacterium]
MKSFLGVRAAIFRFAARTLIALVCLAEATWAQTPAPERATVTLTGLVKSDTGDPVADATVVIARAAPAAAKPVLAGHCEEDCFKFGISDETGRFTIGPVKADQKFTLLVARKGYGTRTIADVDPRQGPPDIVLGGPALQTLLDEDNDVWCSVIDRDGRPAAGAVIFPHGYHQGYRGLQGPMNDVAEPTITDRAGKFHIPSALRVTALDLEVHARGSVPQIFNEVPTGRRAGAAIRLARGATLRGRIVYDGQPRPGIVVGVSWVEHGSGTWFGPWETLTDAAGRFVIANVTPDKQLVVYGKLDSVKEVGCLPALEVRAGDNQDVDLDDIAIVAGHRLKGHLMVSGGQSLPPQLVVQVHRSSALDFTRTPVGEDGSFEFNSLPDETVGLSVLSIPPGESQSRSPFPFHLSAKNRSLDPHNPQRLLGRIDSDLELTVLLEPGGFRFAPAAQTNDEAQLRAEKLRMLRKKRLQGLPAD